MFKLETGVGGKKKVEKLQFKIFNSESREKKKGKGNFFFFFILSHSVLKFLEEKRKRKEKNCLIIKNYLERPGSL